MIEAPTKRPLTLTDLDEQDGFVLPSRETMLVTVVLTNILNNLSVEIDVRNNNVAVQVCAAVSALNTLIAPTVVTCDIQQ